MSLQNGPWINASYFCILHGMQCTTRQKRHHKRWQNGCAQVEDAKCHSDFPVLIYSKWIEDLKIITWHAKLTKTALCTRLSALKYLTGPSSALKYLTNEWQNTEVKMLSTFHQRDQYHALIIDALQNKRQYWQGHPVCTNRILSSLGDPVVVTVIIIAWCDRI